jgi:hypothetical protein
MFKEHHSDLGFSAPSIHGTYLGDVLLTELNTVRIGKVTYYIVLDRVVEYLCLI